MVELKFYDPKWLSEIGKKDINEDTIFPKDNIRNYRYFVVCDGVGGQLYGEIASELACNSVNEFFTQNFNKNIDNNFVNKLYKYIQTAFTVKIDKNPEYKGMATTLTLIIFHSGGYTATWCGDSKIFHIKNGNILFQNKEHKSENGQLYSYISEEEVSRIGIYTSNNIEANDFFIQCTDGVLEGLSIEELVNLCTSEVDNENILSSVKQKCQKNSNDNFSIYVNKIKNANKVFVLKNKLKNSFAKRLLISLLILFILISVVEGFYLLTQISTKATEEINTINQLSEYEITGNKSVENKNFDLASRFYLKAIEDVDNDTIAKQNLNIKIMLLTQIIELTDTIKTKEIEINQLKKELTIKQITIKKPISKDSTKIDTSNIEN